MLKDVFSSHPKHSNTKCANPGSLSRELSVELPFNLTHPPLADSSPTESHAPTNATRMRTSAAGAPSSAPAAAAGASAGAGGGASVPAAASHALAPSPSPIHGTQHNGGASAANTPKHGPPDAAGARRLPAPEVDLIQLDSRFSLFLRLFLSLFSVFFS